MGPKILGAADLPRRPLADTFLHEAIGPSNAYQCTKFQLPRSISFRDNEGVSKYNVGSPVVPLVDESCSSTNRHRSVDHGSRIRVR